MLTAHKTFDFVVIGSGFGGSVSALRLAEKGKRWNAHNLPKTNWRLRRYIWRPALGLRGFFDLRLFRHVVVLQGNAVGGGSITYAQTLWQPKETVWQNGDWAGLADWQGIMPTHYATALKMLGASTNMRPALADEYLHKMAHAYGVGDSYYHTQVGVFFGDKDQPAGASYPDPYFDGKGPARNSCTGCGACMVGCRYNAKNTLDKNYLYLAERLGVVVLEETEVVGVVPLGNSNGTKGYQVDTVRSKGLFKRTESIQSGHVIFAGGSLGTQELLFKMRDIGALPNLSPMLGQKVRTNAESLIGIRFPDAAGDFSKGLAIGSGLFLDENTHIEATRYPKGSDLMGLLLSVLVTGNSHGERLRNWLMSMIKHPIRFLKTVWPFGFARQCMILLCMQSIDGHLNMQYRRSWFWPFKRLCSTGQAIPAYIPLAHDFAVKSAQLLGGTAGATLPEVLLNIPMTAHCIGGAIMGQSPQTGVCDAQMRVWGYEKLWICDGSVISANLGVNPSLTITALAEYAMSQIAPKSLNQ